MRILPLALATVGFANATSFVEESVALQLAQDNSAASEAAQRSIEAIRRLSEAIKATKFAQGIASGVSTALDFLEEAQPEFAIAGVFLSFVELFLPDEDEMILKELAKIEAQIAELRGDMAYYFQKAIDAEKQDTCFSKLATYESKIREAWTNLHNLNKNKHAADVHTYKYMFIDSCAGAQCADATHGILNTIDGDPSFLNCDMMGILYEGNANGAYYRGMRDQVTSKGGYLTTLITMGITVESAYQSLVNNDKEAWKIVQGNFGDSLKGTIKHVKGYDNKAQKELIDNTKINITRIVHENPNLPDKQMVGVVYNMAASMGSNKIAQAIVYGNTGGFNNHFHTCYDCAIMLHVNNKFCFNVAYLDPHVGKPNHPLIAQHFPENASSHHHDARQIGEEAMKHGCYSGAVVVKNGLGYWTEGELMAQKYIHFNSGSHGFVLQFWAQENGPCLRLARDDIFDGLTDEEAFALVESGAAFVEEWPYMW